jgi:MoaA/NifB/PqqE/SkfB family radical SAM enzyme
MARHRRAASWRAEGSTPCKVFKHKSAAAGGAGETDSAALLFAGVRVEKVLVNRSCNQACRFCTVCRDAGEKEFAAEEAVRERIREALNRGVELVVLTGGEPTLSSRLPELVEQIRAAGCRAALETNATLVGDELAQRLKSAGLDQVRVKLASFGGDQDRITGDPGGFARTRAGLEALARAGFEIELRASVIAPSLSSLPALPEEIVAAFGEDHRISAIVVSVPLDTRARAEQVSYLDAARCIAELEQRARLARIPIRLEDGDPMPPCVFPPERRLSHLFQLSGGNDERSGFVRLPPCADCSASASCPGISGTYLRTRVAHDLHPLSSDEQPGADPSSVDSMTRRALEEFVRIERARGPDGVDVARHVVRINFHCDQACEFCPVPTYLPAPPDEAIQAAIRRAIAETGRVVLGGGEPTLSPKLLDWVAFAKRSGARAIELETNGVALFERDLAVAFSEAGLSLACVSLHGSRPEIADRVTRSPGGFERTTAGIDHLRELGVPVLTSFVVCPANVDDFPSYVAFVAGRWPGTSIRVCFVDPISTEFAVTREGLPRHSEVMQALAAGLAQAERLGVEVVAREPLRDVPRCIPSTGSVEAWAGIMRLGPEPPPDLVKVVACTRCRLEPLCPGVRRSYAELHGIGELRPIP